MRRFQFRAPPNARRAAAGLGAALLLTALGGCFVHTDGVAIDKAHRGDVDWLADAWIDEDDAPYTVTRESVGIYRLSGVVAEPEEEMSRGVAMLLGDCSVDVGEDFPKDACTWTPEQLCADEDTRLSDGPECLEMVSALRDPAKQAALDPRMAEAVEGLRWVGEGMPWRDDVLFLVTPLETSVLGESWAAAQVRRIGSFGPYTDLGILAPQLLTDDLVLLERNREGGFVAWSTTYCGDYDAETPLPIESALETLADCADALASGRLARKSDRSVDFRPAPGQQP